MHKIYLISLFCQITFLSCFGQVNKTAETSTTSSVKIKAYVPNATTVHVSGMNGSWGLGIVELDLTNAGNGFWEGLVSPVTMGFHYYILSINGVESLNPIDRAIRASSYIVNGVEVPDPDSDFYSVKDVPHGIIRMHYYKYMTSKDTTVRRCLIYLPPGYDTKNETTYPILYLQHGSGENELSWSEQGKMNNILDNLIADKKAEPMIVVMENGSTSSLAYTFSRGVQAEIESKYKVKAQKEYRAVAGLSAGAGQASDLFFNNLGLFSSVGLFSGSGVDLTNPVYNSLIGLLWIGYGSEDELMINVVPGYVANLNHYHINNATNIYPGGHEWQVWRKCLRDFAPLLFKPYTYENPYNSIEETTQKSENIYPNPFSNTINFDLPDLTDDSQLSIKLSDVSGKTDLEFEATKKQAEDLLSEYLSNAIKGIYILSVALPNSNYQFKIIR
jgi:enterochelin esterase-like enzyme